MKVPVLLQIIPSLSHNIQFGAFTCGEKKFSGHY